MQNNVRPESMERITTKALADAFIAEQVEAVRKQVGDKKVLLALSGGVDSSVVAALLIKAIGKQLVCVHVNHGLMRKGESEQVIEVFGKELDANLIYIDATDRFLDLLKDVAEPERKRKIIGGEFIKVFDERLQSLRESNSSHREQFTPTFLSLTASRLTTTSAAFLMIWQWSLSSRSSFFLRTKFALSERRSAFHTPWSTVSRSRVRDLVSVASAQ